MDVARKTNPGTGLVISAGGARFSISAAELAAHPRSLLASVAESTAGAKGSAPELQLDGLPDSPLSTWPGGAAVVQALYKHGHLPAAQLDDLIDAAGSAQQAHDRLASLLAFLALPGDVMAWLPPVKGMQLRHARCLDVWCCALAVEAAQAMVGADLTAAAAPDRGVAFCLVSTVSEEQMLRVYTLHGRGASVVVAAAHRGRASAVVDRDSMHILDTRLRESGNRSTRFFDLLPSSIHSCGLVGPDHLAFGAPLRAALQAACGRRLRFALVNVTIRGSAAPVWVVLWG